MDSLTAVRRIVGGHNPHRALVVFYLHRVKGLSERKIADTLGLTKSTIHRHRRRVADAIAEIDLNESTLVDMIESAA